MVLIDFSMSPVGKGESLNPYVSRIIDHIDKSGIDYKLTAMGTILEGDYDDVMSVVRGCFNELKKDCPRISMTLKMDYRKGEAGRINSKIDRVEQELNRDLKK